MGAQGPVARFCRLPGGAQVAFASIGHGPPLVMVPGWLSHLSESWAHPAAASARAKLSTSHRFVWFDRLGCGLSDRDGFELSLENDVSQLTAVLDAAGIERAHLVGYSFGAPPAAAFAARHPDRVDRLVLYSAFARGTAIATPQQHEALKHLVLLNWGLGSRTLATMMVPNASAQEVRWFDRFQRTATTADMAARLLDHLRAMDVRDLLPSITTPTLVLHNRGDRAIRLPAGQEIAALIPGARMQVLDGNEHDPFIRDSGAVVESMLAFVDGRAPVAPPVPDVDAGRLTAREQQVLRLVAEGSANKEIAAALGITLATVERHITNLYRKVGARGRADAVMAAVAMGLVRPDVTG